jgi:hypothetical protein
MVHTRPAAVPRGLVHAGGAESVQKWFFFAPHPDGSAAVFYIFHVKQAVQTVSIRFPRASRIRGDDGRKNGEEAFLALILGRDFIPCPIYTRSII